MNDASNTASDDEDLHADTVSDEALELAAGRSAGPSMGGCTLGQHQTCPGSIDDL